MHFGKKKERERLHTFFYRKSKSSLSYERKTPLHDASEDAEAIDSDEKNGGIVNAATEVEHIF